MVWIPKGASKEEEDLILEMSSKDEERIYSVMKQENLGYWEAMKWCLEHNLFLDPVEYEELLEIHEQEVLEKSKPISFKIE